MNIVTDIQIAASKTAPPGLRASPSPDWMAILIAALTGGVPSAPVVAARDPVPALAMKAAWQPSAAPKAGRRTSAEAMQPTVRMAEPPSQHSPPKARSEPMVVPARTPVPAPRRPSVPIDPRPATRRPVAVGSAPPKEDPEVPIRGQAIDAVKPSKAVPVRTPLPAGPRWKNMAPSKPGWVPQRAKAPPKGKPASESPPLRPLLKSPAPRIERPVGAAASPQEPAPKGYPNGEHSGRRSPLATHTSATPDRPRAASSPRLGTEEPHPPADLVLPMVAANPPSGNMPAASPRVAPSIPPRGLPATMWQHIEDRLLSARPGQTVSIALDPPSLGHLTVHVLQRGSTVTARLVVTQPEAREALLQGLGDLKEALARSGIQGGQITVVVQGEGFSFHENGGRPRSSPRGTAQFLERAASPAESEAPEAVVNLLV